MLAKDLLTVEQIARVRKRSWWRGVALIVHAWGVVALAVAGFVLAWQWSVVAGVLVFPLAVMLVGTRQLGFAVLMHDAAHGCLLPNRKANDRIADWLCAWPVFLRTAPYRRYHVRHHARTQQADDPDLVLSAPFPVTPASMWRKVKRDLTGRTGFQQRRAQIKAAWGKKGDPVRWRNFFERMGGIMLAQGVILGVFVLAGYWYLYFLLWLLPFMTWQQLVTRVRNIAEHAMVPDNEDSFRNARTTKAGFIARTLLAPYGVNYHVEHHLLMWVPCFNLPLLRRFLIANGYEDRIETAPSYLHVLRMATSANNDNRLAAPRKEGTFEEGFAVDSS